MYVPHRKRAVLYEENDGCRIYGMYEIQRSAFQIDTLKRPKFYNSSKSSACLFCTLSIRRSVLQRWTMYYSVWEWTALSKTVGVESHSAWHVSIYLLLLWAQNDSFTPLKQPTT